MDHPLANKKGIELVLQLLFHKGDMCPKCAYGTRKTSKRWAKCKRCGERVERRSLDDIDRSLLPDPPQDTNGVIKKGF